MGVPHGGRCGQAGGRLEAGQHPRQVGPGVGSGFYFLGSPGCDFRPLGLWEEEKPVASRVEAGSRGPQIRVGPWTIASCLLGSWSPLLCSPNGPEDELLEGKGFLFWLWEAAKRGGWEDCVPALVGRRAEKPEGRAGAAAAALEQKGRSWGSAVWKEGWGVARFLPGGDC